MTLGKSHPLPSPCSWLGGSKLPPGAEIPTPWGEQGGQWGILMGALHQQDPLPQGSREERLPTYQSPPGGPCCPGPLPCVGLRSNKGVLFSPWEVSDKVQGSATAGSGRASVIGSHFTYEKPYLDTPAGPASFLTQGTACVHTRTQWVRDKLSVSLMWTV